MYMHIYIYISENDRSIPRSIPLWLQAHMCDPLHASRRDVGHGGHELPIISLCIIDIII